MALDYSDPTDFDNADRGFIATLDPLIITDDNGDVVFDTTRYAFLDGDCPTTVNPSLFRQAQLNVKNGLYEVTAGIYQIRGFDLSNMTIVEGDSGVIIIDPLISTECAAAGLALYREHRGDRPVTGVIYTHSHGDHFGGVAGVLPNGRGDVPILAPEGFMAEAVSENVYAGTAMTRRANYMYGSVMDPGPEGIVSTGLGIKTSNGTISLIAPTIDVTHTGQTETIDGVDIEFQLTPGTEAPAEMNFYFPQRRALCLAENVTHNLHNLLTLRGAQVRDPRIWSHYIDEGIELYLDRTDVAFASHHWPTWDRENIEHLMSVQRDLYMYLHDQTLRLLNIGRTGPEIAEEIELPAELADEWSARGYYGSVSHNVKAIYQRYLGWFDGNPASLWEHPPVAQAQRYVKAFGGVDALVGKAKEFRAEGDLRFAAELLKYAVFAAPENATATEELAQVFTELGHGSENATWRNFYLTGAYELRNGVLETPIDFGSGMAMALTVEQIFDSIAIRVNGLRAAEHSASILWNVTDADTVLRTVLSRGVLIRTLDPKDPAADLTVTLTKIELLGLLAGKPGPGVIFDGDQAALATLVSVLDNPDPNFPIVTP